MTKDDFVRTTASAKEWLSSLTNVWSDGQKETNEIVESWTESFKSLTSSTRESLQEMKDTADAAGYTSVSDQLQADIKTLDAMDKEIAALLKKRKNRKLTEKDKLRLQELIDTREAIEVKYHLTAADTEGFTTIRKKVEAEIARAEARGQEVSGEVYQEAMVAAAEGISKEQAMPSVNTEDHDQGMGIEYSYFIEDEISCPHCSASIGYQVYGSEYPVGAYNNDWAAITENAVFLETPRMDVVYDFSDEDIDQAFYYADDLQKRIIHISRVPEDIYDMTSRQFEIFVERLYQNMGFKTILTQPTRDGGKDIIAKKYYESPMPIVRYIDCKHLSPGHSVDESTVREIHGVLHDARINQVILVTTTRFTRDAFIYAKRQGTLIELVDGEGLHKMIKKDAERYYRQFYRV